MTTNSIKKVFKVLGRCEVYNSRCKIFKFLIYTLKFGNKNDP